MDHCLRRVVVRDYVNVGDDDDGDELSMNLTRMTAREYRCLMTDSFYNYSANQLNLLTKKKTKKCYLDRFSSIYSSQNRTLWHLISERDLNLTLNEYLDWSLGDLVNEVLRIFCEDNKDTKFEFTSLFAIRINNMD